MPLSSSQAIILEEMKTESNPITYAQKSNFITIAFPPIPLQSILWNFLGTLYHYAIFQYTHKYAIVSNISKRKILFS